MSVSDPILNPIHWPYDPSYTASCEEVMKRIGIPPDSMGTVMEEMTQAHGAPLQHLEALYTVLNWKGDYGSMTWAEFVGEE